jgi:RHS repeat-associated protein
MTYHVNDMVRTITQGSRTATYTLDVNVGRFRSWIDSRAGGVTKTNHYSTDNDSPAWTDEGDGTYSRTLIGIAGVVGSISGPDGAITWLISNQRGDFVAGIAAGTAGITYTSEYTEYGLPRNPDDAGSRRYGWFGAAQRAGDTPGGLVLMGVRVYAPGNGRFLQVDPIYGGSANSYDYANQDPINQSDASGCAPYRCYIPSWAWRGYVAWADLMTVYLYTSPWYPTELNWLGYVLADYNPVFVLHSMQVQYRIRERVRVKCTVTARYGTGRFQVYSVQMAYAEWQDRYRARYRIRFTTIVTAWTYGFWLTYKISNIRYGRSGYYYT